MKEKQKAFCREYIKDFNGSKAAIRAGYSKKTAAPVASRLLRGEEIQEEIARLSKEAAENADITPDWVLSNLKKIVEMGLGNEEVDVVSKEYVDGVVYTSSTRLKKADLSAAKGALELLGKYHSMFKENMKVDHSGQIIKRIINVNPTKG